MGAWIEIKNGAKTNANKTMSLPLWERGLKCYNLSLFPVRLRVASLVGAWIEIPVLCIALCVAKVASLVGAWIEIFNLCEGRLLALSLPLWERGLKYKGCHHIKKSLPSLPLWERGLKCHFF